MTLNTSRDRLGSVGVRGITALLLAATGNRCALCGDPLNLDANAKDPKRCQVSHVRPALGSKREGWASLNLFAGCGACNDWAGSRDLTPILSAFRIRAGILAWTDAEARRAGKGTSVGKVSADDHGDFRSGLDALL